MNRIDRLPWQRHISIATIKEVAEKKISSQIEMHQPQHLTPSLNMTGI
jgi:hypothetical protein